ncbi:MAG: hypothetical protein ACPGOV_00980 [Magnetovibrionaceae bacterium]
MTATDPTVGDYMQLFEAYGGDLGEIYREPDDERYAFLFEQIIRLLIKPSAYNLSLPEPFRISAHRYHDGDPKTLQHLGDPENRHFMLCDLNDYVLLNGGLAWKRRRESQSDTSS